MITGIRVKDEKKGWFVYRWRSRRDEVENFIEGQKRKSPKGFNKDQIMKILRIFIIVEIMIAQGLPLKMR